MSIEIINGFKNFNGLKVLENFNIKFPDTGIIGISGPSGSGKTTLLKIIIGILKLDSGIITRGHHKDFSVVFQDSRVILNDTVLENVKVVIREKENKESIAISYIKKVGLESFLKEKAKNLSGGMLKRLEIARALAFSGDTFILDEPFTGVDNPGRKNLIKLLKEELKGKLTIVVTHDEGDLVIFAGRVCHLG